MRIQFFLFMKIKIEIKHPSRKFFFSISKINIYFYPVKKIMKNVESEFYANFTNTNSIFCLYIYSFVSLHV